MGLKVIIAFSCHRVDIQMNVLMSDIKSDVFIEKISDIPTDVLNNSKDALKSLLPDKSNKKYLKCFHDFADWQKSKAMKFIVNEMVLLDYFGELAKKYQPSTLWSMYSMLKSTIICLQNIDISKYSRLTSFLKKKNNGFRSKKSKVFSAEEVKKFLVEAPDNEYLVMKTVVVFGAVGACRGDEITNVKCEYVRDTGNEIVIKIPNTKHKVQKAYVINGEFAEIVRKYMKVRPDVVHDRFFLQYRNGRCTVQVQGKNNIAKMPKKIAQFLQLPEYEAYTGHSIRRTSTTILADNGAGLDTIKRHENWKSNTVAEGYIQESLGHKRKIESVITEAINLPSMSDETSECASKRVASSTVTHSTALPSNLNALSQNANETFVPASKILTTSAITQSSELSENAENGSQSMSQRLSQQTLTTDKVVTKRVLKTFGPKNKKMDSSSDDSETDFEKIYPNDGSIDYHLYKMEHQFQLIKKHAVKESNKYLFKNKVHEVLSKTAGSAGDFAVFGKLNKTPLVVISVKNANAVGPIKFPLNDNEVQEIIGLFERSPYGKGSETIVDTAVRNSWQLAADQFEILNADWDTFINQELASRIMEEMSLECSFELSLHKLLLYSQGSFFKLHRDSEKQVGMFATLVIQLPSKYEGGQLVVRHDGKIKTIDFSSSNSENNGFSTFFSAFYSDCEHEILTVTQGYRFCLVYNLISKNSIATPRNHSLEIELMSLLDNWSTPTKLVYALTHKYSESNLSLQSLKTTDRGVANILKYIAEAAGISVYLAILQKDDTVQFNYHINYDHASYNLKNLHAVAGCELPSSAILSVQFDTEIIPQNCFDKIIPYEKTHEPTGSDGIQVSKRYQSAAIVFWRKKLLFPVLKQSRGIAEDNNFIENALMIEVRKYLETDDEANKAKILTCSKELLAARNNDDLIKVLTKFHDLELVRHLPRHFIHFYNSNIAGESFPETLIKLIDVCETYGGWHIMSELMLEMFRNVSKKDVMDNLKALFEKNVFRNKNEKMTLQHGHRILKGILEMKRTYESEEEQDILHSICLLVKKTKFDLVEFAKIHLSEDIVPVLVRLNSQINEL